MTSGSGARYRASPSAPLYRNRWLPDRVLRFRLRDFRDVRRVRLQRGMLFKHCTKLFCTHSIFWRYGIAHTRTRLRVPAVPPRSEERGPRFSAEVKKRSLAHTMFFSSGMQWNIRGGHVWSIKGTSTFGIHERVFCPLVSTDWQCKVTAVDNLYHLD